MKTHYLLSIATSLFLTACGNDSNNANPPYRQALIVDSTGNTQINIPTLEMILADYNLGVLTEQEQASLIYMREEEKLAEDVYSALFTLHQLPVFANISDSEATHTEAVKVLLDRYNLNDPAINTAPGEFTDARLQTLYDNLLYQGTPSLIDALTVGVLIEELDIFDLTAAEAQLDNNQDILFVYENLKKGSRNHLRAFYRQLTNNGGSYTPVYLSQQDFDAIVNSSIETGR